jgi:hypothetical protein
MAMHLRRLLYASALAVAALLATSSAAHAQKVPLFFYDAPESATPLAVNAAIADQSGAGNNGRIEQATVATVADTPTGSGYSFNVGIGSGSVRTLAIDLLDNADVLAAGGFQFDVWFKTDGTSSGIFGSLINYAGTERIELAGQAGGPGGLADKNYLEFRVSSGGGDYVANPTKNISDNQWHHVTSKFIVTDASDPRNLRGDMHLILDGVTHIYKNGVKTSQGDDLNRVISIGNHPTASSQPAGLNNTDNFDGLIYQPKAWLGYDLDTTQQAVLLKVDRATGGVTLQNVGPALDVVGYSLRSPKGVLKSNASWQSITTTKDANSGGSFDPNDNWMEFERSAEELAETSFGSQIFAQNQNLFLGNVLNTNPFRDLSAEILLADGSIVNGYVQYAGAGPKLGDLNFDGTIDLTDFNMLNGGLFSSHGATVTGYQAYQAGDIDGDGDTDEIDFIAFKRAFVADNPVAAAAAGFAIPEPASWLLALGAGVLLVRRRSWGLAKSALATATVVVSLNSTANAAVTPVFSYDASGLPTGTLTVGTIIEDQSAANRDATVTHHPIGVSTDVPAGFTGKSFDFYGTVLGASGDSGGLLSTIDKTLLKNDAVVAAGGFTMEVWFKTDGVSNGGTGKLIDYGGYERIQFSGSVPAGQAPDRGQIDFRISNTAWRVGGNGPKVDDNGWHHAIAEFKVTNGSNLASVVGDISITVDGNRQTIFNAAKTNAGDNINPSIGIGNRPTVGAGNAANTSGDNFQGLMYQPKVYLGVVDEPMKLRVNTATGAVTLQHSENAIAPSLTRRNLDLYKITSAAGVLNAGAWNSLDEQGIGGGGGSAASGDFNGDLAVDGGDFLQWQRTFGSSVGSGTGADGSGNGVIDAADLNLWKSKFGQAVSGGGLGWQEAGVVSSNVIGETFLTGSTLFSGNNSFALGNIFTPGGVQDLVFTYHVAGDNGLRTGLVEYFTPAAAVPEPASWMMLAGAAAVGWLRRRRVAAQAAVCGAAVVLGTATGAEAARFVDRDYKLGESDPGSPTVGSPVGQSYDDAGTLGNGSLHDLTGAGDVKYANVSGRPFAAGSTLGVEFDGNGDFLSGARFGAPSTSISSTASGGPIDYGNILNRGMQFWVNPHDAKLGDGQLQSVVMDTNRHGVMISGNGTWMMRYNATALTTAITNDIDTGVAVKRDNAADGSGGWHHVMLVRPYGSSAGAYGGGARLYVDGVPIAFRSGTYTSTDDAPLVLGANTSSIVTGAETSAGTADFFRGVIDDLELFALGTTNGTPRVNHGEFDLRTDNEFIAASLAGKTIGDLTGDNVVGGTGAGGPNDDVAVFVSNWRRTNEFDNGAVTVGGLNTYAWGDFNMDGKVNFTDWAILRDAHPQGPSLDLAAILAGVAVPEPSAVLLAATAFGLIAAKRRRTR